MISPRCLTGVAPWHDRHGTGSRAGDRWLAGQPRRAERSNSLDQLFAAVHAVLALLSSPPPMLLFRTPLGCETFIHHLPAHRAEAHRSIRAPVVHVGASDSSPSQRLSLDPRLPRETGGGLRLTGKLFRFTSRVSVSPGSLRIPSRRRRPRPS